MLRRWKSLIAGILTIIVGIPGIIGGFLFTGTPIIELIAISIIALIGGICAIIGKLWGFGLAGAICATALFAHLGPMVLPFGIVAIILLALGKGEFT